ncbi:MAG: response regulator [Verrucomicrobiota bacterium]
MKNNTIPQAGEPDSAPLQREPNAPQHILVVDDDSGIRNFSTRVLVGSGYHVDTAEDGAAAWEALQIKAFNLLITDNNMPRLTGVELVKKLHSARMALPVIMATRTSPKEEFTQYPWLQPAATLLKPYTIAELLGTVKEVLRATDSPREQVDPLPNWRSQPSADGLRPG